MATTTIEIVNWIPLHADSNHIIYSSDKIIARGKSNTISMEYLHELLALDTLPMGFYQCSTSTTQIENQLHNT
jgi:hypothetical protein